METVAALTQEHDVEFLLPVTDVTVGSIFNHPSLIPPDVVLPFASKEAVELLSNKNKLFQLAEVLGLPTPRTFYVDSAITVQNVRSELVFPLVIKPFRSRIYEGDSWISTAVTYAETFDDLCRRVEETSYLASYPFMLQEIIRGTSRGLFTLYKDGRPVAFFGHQRIREKPPSGGVSVVSESCSVSRAMIEVADKLLGHAAWEGAAMVEFIVTDDGTPFLMEVNTRFWGSLQLSIDAGVDFPYLLYKAFSGAEVDSIQDYREGRRLRWLLGDLDRLYLVLRNRDANYRSSGKLAELIEFLRPTFGPTRHEINRLSDFGPALFEVRKYVADLL